jgi:hypothetical protein
MTNKCSITRASYAEYVPAGHLTRAVARLRKEHGVTVAKPVWASIAVAQT